MRYEFKPSDQRAPKVRLNATMFAAALQEMAQGPTTRAQLIEETGLSRVTINSLVSALHKRGLIYIAGWDKDAAGRSTIAAFSLGEKADAKKPRARTDAENKRAQREARRKNATLHATAGGMGAGLGA